MLGNLIDRWADGENQVGRGQAQQQVRECISTEVPKETERAKLVVGAEGIHTGVAHRTPVDAKLCVVIAGGPRKIIGVLKGS